MPAVSEEGFADGERLRRALAVEGPQRSPHDLLQSQPEAIKAQHVQDQVEERA